MSSSEEPQERESKASGESEAKYSSRPSSTTKYVWRNPGSYKYYIPKVAAAGYNRTAASPRIPLATKQLKAFYAITTAFKIAKIIAAVLIALAFMGWL